MCNDGSKIICTDLLKWNSHVNKWCVWLHALWILTNAHISPKFWWSSWMAVINGIFNITPQTHGEDIRASTPDPGCNGGAGCGPGAGRGSERCLGTCWRPLYWFSAGPHRCHQGRHTQKTMPHYMHGFLSLFLFVCLIPTHTLYMHTHYHESQI